jgi:23S rRNA (guanosine2251-2'-O)-methyltransferase
MSETVFYLFQCENPQCGFRCPVSPTDRKLTHCPKCKHDGILTSHVFVEPEIVGYTQNIYNPEVVVLLDNIRSTYNVGSIFRSADGAGIRKLYLGGYTPTPEHPKLVKTGLGAEKFLPWESMLNGLNLIKSMKSKGYQIWSLEKCVEAESIFQVHLDEHCYPLILVVGNERVGVDPEILAISDRVVDIPMLGMKRSLNVASAFGIAAYILTGMLKMV